MWTPETRSQHDRDELRYSSDLTDAEWQVLKPFFPPPAQTGRHRAWPMREVVNAIFYVLRGGVPWRMLPEHFPPHQTTYRWFVRFRDTGLWETINHDLVMRDRERVGREANPSAAIIDTQSVKTTEAGGPRGYDAAKKINGRKRHAMVDTDGRGLGTSGPSSIRAGPRWRHSVAEGRHATGTHSIQNGVRRQRLCRRKTRQCDRALSWRSSGSLADQVGFAGSAAPLGCRTLPGLDQPQPPARQGFRGHNRARLKAFLYAACVMLLTRRLARSV